MTATGCHADILNAKQIEKLGLANRIVDDANLESETMAFAKKRASGPRVAWWHVKKNMKIAEEGCPSSDNLRQIGSI